MFSINNMEIQMSRDDTLRMSITEKSIGMLHAIKGVEKAFLLDESDLVQIKKLEKQDELTSSLYFGKKDNVGVKQVLKADILLAFVTTKEYDWPRDNLKIMHGGEVIGTDVSDPAEIEQYQSSGEHCVFGNIVLNCTKMRKFQKNSEPPVLVISGKPWKEVESINFVSEALIASPSRMTDEYLKSILPSKSKLHIGTFLVGLYLKRNTSE